jgi:GT2 family glycosyltransferase
MALFRKRDARGTENDKVIPLIAASDLFDAAWYLKRYPDVAAAEMDPAYHFAHHGAGEGRNPGPYFDTCFYLESNPDVLASGMNALVHYTRHGLEEGRPRLPGGAGADAAIAAASTTPLPGLFEGSTFDELSITDPGAITHYIAASATHADALSRVDEKLYSPLISIVMPIYNTPPRFFREVLQSVFAQTYTKWELCMVDDGSSSPATHAIFDEITRSHDSRIKTQRLERNLGIAGASQAALELATGDYVGFLDHDDMLTPNALSEVVAALRMDPTIDFAYTDHVMIGQEGFPKYFSHKPAWSPEFLLSTNYIVHFKVVRRSLLLSIGGLENELDNVQDLGVSCSLVAAGARVHHVAKPVYLWREHRTSVALSTAAKPGIEGLLLQVYDRYLQQLGIAAKQVWPTAYKATRTGVFQLEFEGQLPSTALILLARGTDENEADIRARVAPLLGPAVTLHIVSLTGGPGAVGTVIASDAAMLDFVSALDSEIVAFATTTGQYLGIDWLERLSRYVAMDPKIGAAGGKVLDSWLQIRSAGMLSDAAGEYRTIAGGDFDNKQAHWFIGQIASNVDAVSSQLMATRRSTLIQIGGIGFHAFGDAAGTAYCAALVAQGYRIVYDPHSRQCDTGRFAVPAAAWSRIRELGREAAPRRRYRSLGA